MDRKTKTICTIGPNSQRPEILEQLVKNGMDIARMNMSHATHDEFNLRKALINEYNTMYGKDVKILMDLQGPRMRVGECGDKGIELREGEIVLFSTNAKNEDAIFVNDPYLHEDIEVDHPMYLANGDLELIITEKNGQDFKALVTRGGTLHSRKGVNLPETNLTTRGLTDKDLADLEFGLKQGIDYVAMSFVKDAEDINNLRTIINNPAIKVIAKIEIKQALYNIDEIIQAVDVIMVARGDLGIEVPLEELPLIQKEMIRRCKKYNTPAIVATQMLMSMVEHYRPTRAEVSDVANAVLDGADILMLSDETAFGKYPVEALKYLVNTARKAEMLQYEEAATLQGMFSAQI